MATLTFDTLKFVKRLKRSGFSEEQAEALSDAFRESAESSVEDLATKQDIELLRRDIKEVEVRFSGEMKLIKWMMGFVLAGILALILKTFFP